MKSNQIKLNQIKSNIYIGLSFALFFEHFNITVRNADMEELTVVVPDIRLAQGKHDHCHIWAFGGGAGLCKTGHDDHSVWLYCPLMQAKGDWSGQTDTANVWFTSKRNDHKCDYDHEIEIRVRFPNDP